MAAMDQVRQPRGIAVALRDPLPWQAFSGAAQLAEDLGYAAVLLPETSGRDAVAALTGLAGETSTLLLGTGVLPMTSRSSRLIAMGAATVQERSGGRAILGLGTGPAVPGALDRLRALVAELRTLLRAAPAADGTPSLVATPVPIWLSALGPRALETAGEIADGVLLNWCPPQRVSQAREAVRGAALRSDRDPDLVTVAVYVRASLGGDEAAALAALRAAAGEYASYPAYARQLAALGLGGEVEAAAAARRARRPDEVPESLVRAVALLGDPAAARTGLQAYREAGADLVVVYPVVTRDDPTGSLTATIRSLAPAG